MRRLIVTALTATLVATSAAGAVARPSVGGARSTRPSLRVVGKDPVGDWTPSGLSPVADALGEDLVSASVGLADGKTLAFVLGLHTLPSEEVAQQSFYLYGFNVDGDDWFVTNGCNPYEPQRCPESVSDNGFQVVHCDDASGVSICSSVGVAVPKVDVTKGTIEVPVPMTLVGADHGSVIGAGRYGVHAAPGRSNDLSYDGDPVVGDELLIHSVYVVP